MTRSLRNTLKALTALIAAAVVLMPAGATAADAGVIEIHGTTPGSSTSFNLTDVAGRTVSIPGQSTKGWPLRRILVHAQQVTGNAFDINTFEDSVEVSRTGGEPNLSVAEHLVPLSSMDNKLPVYFLDADGYVNMRDPSREIWTYTGANPQIFIPRSGQSVSVDITSPKSSVKLDAGDSQLFVAKVNNPAAVSIELAWLVNGSEKQSGGTASSGRFEYEFAKSGAFSVSVVVKIGGQTLDGDAVNVTVGKAPKPKKKKKKDKEEDEPADETPDDSGYVPGYYPDYGSGSGTGTGTPSPGSSSPSTQQPKKKQPKEDQPSDDGLETVSGQLVDPTQIATVVPSETPAATGEEEAEPAEEEGKGGGISKGALTALGIGALLGLGGLTEAGAFAGFRRFRFRP